MAPSQSDEQALLDRLNALRPTAVSLDKGAGTAADHPVLGLDAQPVSREDALAARLRTLRSQRGGSTSRDEPVSQGEARSRPLAELEDEDNSRTSPPPVGFAVSKDLATDEKTLAPEASLKMSAVRPGCANRKLNAYSFRDAEMNDEDALDELLANLGDEQFDLATVEDPERAPGSDPNDEAKKVADLLESLQQGSRDTTSTGDHEVPDDDDDSEGEEMTRAVETVLSQIGDEISSLPPPAAIGDGATNADLDADQSPFTLPTVPLLLQDPILNSKPEDEFEKDITTRMASLRGLGALDALGLPSAPTFQPQDRHTSDAGKGLLRSSKYTDEDQQTWCVVCLEDATIRCVGCDNDVYCARCWKEMHVGPSAGYEERGHQWVKFGRSHQA